MAKKGPEKQPVKYLFGQNRGASCNVMPFINLGILQQLREKIGADKLNLTKQGQWYSKRDWYAQTFLWIRTWQQAMASLEGTAFDDYRKEQMENGIMAGHIFDAAGNRVDQTLNPLENKARLLLVPYNFTDADALTPELREHHIWETYQTLPLFFHNGQALCYNPENGEYEALVEVTDQAAIDAKHWDVALTRFGMDLEPEENPQMGAGRLVAGVPEAKIDAGLFAAGVSGSLAAGIPIADAQPAWLKIMREKLHNAQASIMEEVENISEYASSAYAALQSAPQVAPEDKFDVQAYYEENPPNTPDFRYYKLRPQQKVFLGLPDNAVLPFYRNSVLGFDAAYIYRYLPFEAETHIYYQSSLNQLILFAMGVDNKGETIDESHPLFEAYDYLREAMEWDDENPWNLPSFRKENFLEYQIGRIIKSDPKLKQQMKATVDIFFPSFEYYRKLDQWYDSPDPATRKSLKNKKEYILSEDQYLAYCFAQSTRFLWAAATSREAFNGVLELEPAIANIMRLPGALGPNQVMRNANKKVNGVSFLDLWEQIRAKLIQNKTVPDEMVSFSCHGVVTSLRKDLFEQQMAQGVARPDIMQRLGISIIDSHYGEQLNPAYRQPAEKVPKAKDFCRIIDLVKFEDVDGPEERVLPEKLSTQAPILNLAEKRAKELPIQLLPYLSPKYLDEIQESLNALKLSDVNSISKIIAQNMGNVQYIKQALLSIKPDARIDDAYVENLINIAILNTTNVGGDEKLMLDWAKQTFATEETANHFRDKLEKWMVNYHEENISSQKYSGTLRK